jgi:hydrogenase maturation protease
MRSTLILGLGNSILTDDGVGIRVVQEVQSSLASSDEAGPAPYAFAEASVGGLRLLEILAGHDRAILVDAIQTRGGTPGDISFLKVSDLSPSLHSGSTHDLTLPEALTFGRVLGMELPDNAAITIVAIEVEDVLTFGEGCTPTVEEVIPKAVRCVMDILRAQAGS